ncbi:MAG: hypothetical protein RIS64_466 [Bacteroidota bacterium]
MNGFISNYRVIIGNKSIKSIRQQLSETQAYKIWAGYAFETLCHKYIQSIKNILQIGAVYTKIYQKKNSVKTATF